MSEFGIVDLTAGELYRARARVLSLYFATAVICLIAIGVLVAYSIELGPLVGPGVEQSFGFAVAMMFLLGALMAHVLDRAYREWPLGRRFHAVPPSVVTDARIAGTLRIAVFVGAALLVAYILSGVLS